MSIQDLKSEHPRMPARPTQAAASSRHSDFPPTYETQVNYELRNFDQLEGQIGALSYDPRLKQDHTTGFARKRNIILAFVALLLMAIAASLTMLLVHGSNRSSTPAPQQQPASANEPQSRRTVTETAWSPAASIVTTEVFTTKIATVTQFVTVIASPSILSSTIVESDSLLSTTITGMASMTTSTTAAASSIDQATQSLESAIISSASERSSESSKTLTTSPTPTSSTAIIPPTAAAETLITSMATSTATPTASQKGWIGFCGVPGAFCVKRDVEEGMMEQ